MTAVTAFLQGRIAYLAGGELPHEHAEGVDVCAVREAAAAEQLGRHVCHGAVRLRGYVRVLLIVQHP